MSLNTIIRCCIFLRTLFNIRLKIDSISFFCYHTGSKESFNEPKNLTEVVREALAKAINESKTTNTSDEPKKIPANGSKKKNNSTVTNSKKKLEMETPIEDIKNTTTTTPQPDDDVKKRDKI